MFSIDQDEVVNYRGIEIDNILIMKESITMNSLYKNMLPHQFILYQNYPNPFNPSTNISFFIPYVSDVSISIYDIKGRFIEKIVDQISTSGYHSFQIDLNNYSSGIYIYQLESDPYIQSKKFIIIK